MYCISMFIWEIIAQVVFEIATKAAYYVPDIIDAIKQDAKGDEESIPPGD